MSFQYIFRGFAEYLHKLERRMEIFLFVCLLSGDQFRVVASKFYQVFFIYFTIA